MKYLKTFNESVRNLMTPKSEEEVNNAYEPIADKIANILIDMYDYDDYLNAYNWAIDHQDVVLDMIEGKSEEDYDLNDVIYKILYGWEGAIDESIRNLMTPKSEEEVNNAIEKLGPNKKLLYGCKYGVLSAVKQAIEDGASLEYNDSVLSVAVDGGQTEIVKYLLDKGFNVHMNNDEALKFASSDGNLEITKILLDAGANVYTSDDYPMRMAEYNKDIKMKELLKQYMHKSNESIQTFNVKELKNKEVDHFERELSYRKKMREEDDNDYEFDELKDSIINEIETDSNYHIATGNKSSFFAGKEKQHLHIEYQSDNIGRVKIFNPDDNSIEGYFEVNGKMHQVDADEIRNFYHYLNQIIKNKPILESVENNQFEGTMVHAQFDDWEGLYIDGGLFDEGHSIHWSRLLQKLIEKGVDLSKYKLTSFPRYLTEEDGDELGGSLPKNLIALYKTLNIEL